MSITQLLFLVGLAGIAWGAASTAWTRSMRLNRVGRLAFSPDGALLAVSFRSGGIDIYDTGSGRLHYRFATAQPTGHSLTFAPDGKTLIAGGDGRIRLFDLSNGSVTASWAAGVQIYQAAVSPDSKVLAIMGPNGRVKLWDLDSKRTAHSLASHQAGSKHLVFSPDGNTIATGSSDGTAKLWDVASGELIATLPGHYNGVNALAFSPDGKTLATSAHVAQIRLWNVADGNQIQTLEGWAQSIRFSPDGRTLLAAAYGRLTVWDLTTAREIRRSSAGRGDVRRRSALSASGSKLAVANPDYTLEIWDTDDRTPAHVVITRSFGTGYAYHVAAFAVWVVAAFSFVGRNRTRRPEAAHASVR